MVNSLLTAIVRADGDALVMHVGEPPYVVSATGPIQLSSRPITVDAVAGMLAQLLPAESRRVFEELGTVEYDLPPSAFADGERFTAVVAGGGDDVWIEIRRNRALAEGRARPGERAASRRTGGVAPEPEPEPVEPAAPEPVEPRA